MLIHLANCIFAHWKLNYQFYGNFIQKLEIVPIALIAVIGLALFAFVLDPSTLTDFLIQRKSMKLVEVDGETISRLEYAEALDTYENKN